MSASGQISSRSGASKQQPATDEVPPQLNVPPRPTAMPDEIARIRDTKKVCRVCAKVSNAIFPIFTGEGERNQLAEKIHKYLPIKISKEDQLPQKICKQCASSVMSWHLLVRASRLADMVLRRQFDERHTPPDPLPTTSLFSPMKSVPINIQTVNLSTVEVKRESEASEEPVEEAARPPVIVSESGKRYVCCTACGKKVAARSWRRHARTHAGERRYSCAACGLAFADSGNLARHARALHARQRPHRCPRCHRGFTRRCHLQDHVRTHDAAREFVCDVCGKAYKSAAALRTHRRRHDELCRFQCMECGSKFKRSAELKAHVTVHTGEKAHECPCGKTFRLRSQLTAHTRTHGRRRLEEFMDVPLPLERRPTDCTFCSDDPVRDRYEEYVERTHENRVFHCQACDTNVPRAALLQHMTMHARPPKTFNLSRGCNSSNCIRRSNRSVAASGEGQSKKLTVPNEGEKHKGSMATCETVQHDKPTTSSQEDQPKKMTAPNEVQLTVPTEEQEHNKLTNPAEGAESEQLNTPNSEPDRLITPREDVQSSINGTQSEIDQHKSSPPSEEEQLNSLNAATEAEPPKTLTAPSGDEDGTKKLDATSETGTSSTPITSTEESPNTPTIASENGPPNVRKAPNEAGQSNQFNPPNLGTSQGQPKLHTCHRHRGRQPKENQKIIVVIQRYKNLCQRHRNMLFEGTQLRSNVLIQDITINKQQVSPGQFVNAKVPKVETRTSLKREHDSTSAGSTAANCVVKTEPTEEHTRKAPKKSNDDNRKKQSEAKTQKNTEKEARALAKVKKSKPDVSPPKRPRRSKKITVKIEKETDDDPPAAEPAPVPATTPASEPAPAPASDAKSSEKSPKASRTCPICGKMYRASSSYFYHMKYFHKRSREHECPACGKKFGTRASLAQHASTHSGAYELECKECGKRFRSKPSLYIHEQSHGGAKRWACAQCGRSFRWRTHLARHAQRHAAARAHVCTTCGRGFSVRCDLLRHARTHAAAEYHCDACPLKFAQKRYLKVHVLKKHAPASTAAATATTSTSSTTPTSGAVGTRS